MMLRHRGMASEVACWPLGRCDDRSAEMLSPRCEPRSERERPLARPLLDTAGRQPEIGRRDVMPINVLSVAIVIALGIIALAARAADGGK